MYYQINLVHIDTRRVLQVWTRPTLEEANAFVEEELQALPAMYDECGGPLWHEVILRTGEAPDFSSEKEK